MKEDIHVVGKDPILSLALHFDEENEEIKPSLIPDATDQEKITRLPLSAEEAKLLEDCENAIDDALSGFHTVGQHLRTIKLKKLYRATHDTFEQYCQERFGFGQNYGNRVVRAAEVVDNLKSVPIGTVRLPATEAHARAMVGLSPEKQIEVATNVKKKVGDSQPTTADFKEEVDKVSKKDLKPATAKQSKSTAGKGICNKPPGSGEQQEKFPGGNNHKVEAQPTPKVASRAGAPDEQLMSWTDVHQLVIDLHNDYLNSLTAKVNQGFRVLRDETKKLAQAEQFNLKEAA